MLLKVLLNMLLQVIPRKPIICVTFHSTYCSKQFKQSTMKFDQSMVKYNTPKSRCILFSGNSAVYAVEIIDL